MRWLGCAALVMLGLLTASCRFVPTAEVQALASGPGTEAAFDPDKQVASIWTSKVIPYFERKAAPLAEVRDLVAKSPDEAGAKFGYRPTNDAPWTFAVRLDGTIIAADTESRAATLSIDTTGAGKPDAIVQIGPALRGAAIRDALSFISFNDFTNQIDFARFGKAFNTHVNRELLEKLPRDGLVGRKATVVGAWPLTSPSETPFITPVEITLGPKP